MSAQLSSNYLRLNPLKKKKKKKNSLDLKRPIFVCFESYKFIGADI